MEHDSVMTGSLFQVVTSVTAIPLTIAWRPQDHLGHEFYSNLLNLEESPIPLQSLTEAISTNALTIQCGSNYNTDTLVKTSVWSFYTTCTLYTHTSQGILAKTRRRAELTS
ncbi:MAG: hypothetical protein ACK53Y_11505, partial [bacterium]